MFCYFEKKKTSYFQTVVISSVAITFGGRLTCWSSHHMFVPPVGHPLSEEDITKHTLSGVSLRTHAFTLFASVATTAAGAREG